MVIGIAVIIIRVALVPTTITIRKIIRVYQDLGWSFKDDGKIVHRRRARNRIMIVNFYRGCRDIVRKFLIIIANRSDNGCILYGYIYGGGEDTGYSDKHCLVNENRIMEQPLWFFSRWGKREGIVRKNVLATYTHLHALGCQVWGDGVALCARGWREQRQQKDTVPFLGISESLRN